MLGPAPRSVARPRSGPALARDRAGLSFTACCSLGKRSSEGNHSSLVPAKRESRPWSKGRARPETCPTAGPLPASRDAETGAGVEGKLASVPQWTLRRNALPRLGGRGPTVGPPSPEPQEVRTRAGRRRLPDARSVLAPGHHVLPLPVSEHGCCRAHRSNLWTWVAAGQGHGLLGGKGSWRQVGTQRSPLRSPRPGVR